MQVELNDDQLLTQVGKTILAASFALAKPAGEIQHAKEQLTSEPGIDPYLSKMEATFAALMSVTSVIARLNTGGEPVRWELEEAVGKAKEVLKEFPSSTFMQKSLTCLLVQLQDWEAAIDFLDDVATTTFEHWVCFAPFLTPELESNYPVAAFKYKNFQAVKDPHAKGARCVYQHLADINLTKAYIRSLNFDYQLHIASELLLNANKTEATLSLDNAAAEDWKEWRAQEL
jgi:hypothetical protein